jgi:hypothetical protein
MAGDNSEMDLSDVGQQKTYETPEKKMEAKDGTYKDKVDSLSTEQLVPQLSIPTGADPSPFKLGPMAPGGRKE